MRILTAVLCVLTLTLGGCLAGSVAAKLPDSADDGQDTTFAVRASMESTEVASKVPSPAPVQGPAVTPAPRADRIVVYSAGLRLVVVSTSDTMRAIHKLAEEQGGYMDEQTSAAITIRVPAPKFNAVVESIEKMGELVDRNIKAQDVTEQMIDLRTHLETAESTRAQLGDLLKKADKIEDTLRIESELRRLSEEIAITKNKIRMLESRVAMSSIRVELNAIRPHHSRKDGLGLPFDWIEQIGNGLIAGQVQGTTRKAGIFGAGPSFKTPPGFVRYFQSSEVTEAMDAADLRLKVHEHKNLDDGDIAFWTKLARRVLVESRALSVSSENTDGNLSTIRGTREISGKQYAYLLTLRRSKSKVVIFEAWGPQDQFDAARRAIEASSKTTSGSGVW